MAATSRRVRPAAVERVEVLTPSRMLMCCVLATCRLSTPKRDHAFAAEKRLHSFKPIERARFVRAAMLLRELIMVDGSDNENGTKPEKKGYGHPPKSSVRNAAGRDHPLSFPYVCCPEGLRRLAKEFEALSNLMPRSAEHDLVCIEAPARFLFALEWTKAFVVFYSAAASLYVFA